MRIYLARHGETDWNRAHRVQGSQDTELNETGIAQAEALAEQLRAEGRSFDALYSSTQKRALHTAEIVSRAIRVPVQTDPRLTEINFGKWEGHSWQEIEELFPEEFQYYSEDRWHHRVPDGESHGILLERALAALRDIAAGADADADILVISHGALILALRCAQREEWGWESLLNYSIANASLMELTEKDLRHMGILPSENEPAGPKD